MYSSPAFTAVSTRKTLGRSDVAISPLEPQPAPRPVPAKKVEWPPAVRAYVQRSFAPEAAIPGIDYKDMEITLKGVITAAAEKERLHTIDWANHLLPQEIILKERSQAPTPQVSHIARKEAVEGEVAMGGVSPQSKKRKNGEVDMNDVDNGKAPPWRKANNRNVFEDRVTYANKEQATRVDKRQRKNMEQTNGKGLSKFQADLDKRKQRFGNALADTTTSPPRLSSREDSPGAIHGPVIGTCQDLEKRYLRLTAAPKPEFVRPQHILEKTLELLKKKWRKENNYGYICDQFKSVRQDLTVQHIKNDFTVNVYEIHARIALEKGDLGEYNQCQSQLRALYSQKLGGHPGEFFAYRILYFIHTCNRTGMNDLLADLTTAEKAQPAVRHALDVRSALALGNYHRFFRLYLETPNMGAYLMDMFIVRERLAALANICRAYKPTLAIRFTTEELGFESDQACVGFLIDHGAHHLLEEKDKVLVLAVGKAGVLLENAKKAAFARVDIKGQI